MRRAPTGVITGDQDGGGFACGQGFEPRRADGMIQRRANPLALFRFRGGDRACGAGRL